MPNLLNRFKHEEFESNSAFQIRNQKERRSKRGAEEEQKKSRKAGAISHPCAKFSPAFFTFCHFYSLFPIFALHVYKCESKVFLYFSYESFI